MPILSTILAASEGLMGVSLDPTDDGDARYCLVPRAMFFELVPVSADSGETAKMRGGTLLPHEATIGRDYELVITNLGGLYRYRIGDVVCGWLSRRTLLVEFRYRIGQLLNLRGEKLSEPQLSAPWSRRSRQARWESTLWQRRRVLPATLSRVHGAAARPTIVRSPTKALAQELDSALCEESRVYKTWREKRAIGSAEGRPFPAASSL